MQCVACDVSPIEVHIAYRMFQVEDCVYRLGDHQVCVTFEECSCADVDCQMIKLIKNYRQYAALKTLTLQERQQMHFLATGQLYIYNRCLYLLFIYYHLYL